MSEWKGTIVGRIYRVRGLKDEPVYLILVDDGDRIWRYESELELERQEGRIKQYKVGSKE
jgi:hypothetical protein